MATQKTLTSYSITSDSKWTTKDIIFYSIVSVIMFGVAYFTKHSLSIAFNWFCLSWIVWFTIDTFANIKINKETTITREEN